ncbi:hypothetical protein [Sphingomonas albertensis]|uniref:Uncharacterized protein n=1 Tax=Sphingomonas albertensis TaxID=2762591 RepID=A0ABR7AN30_9SPHN|nr:hypothetical protein [Sphingomonas albertensis]MBC3941866.1 hypothetical protein [Sphingomonas albertensis]
MPKLSGSAFASAWLDKFDEVERVTATLLIDEIMLVRRDELHRGLVGLLDTVAAGRSDHARPLALFAERAVVKTGEEIDPFFPGGDRGRATGAGVPAIAPDDPQVGSEGTVANLITSYSRLHGGSVLSHPGPDAMRKEKVGPIVIVTDFIGSGKRVTEMLEAFARVATLQSWRSYDYVSFHVVAYSGTIEGIATVRASRLRPRVHVVTGCPTIHDVFDGAELVQVSDLCRRYPGRQRYPLGFNNGGALIAFAHGVPNNAPYILHSTKGGWQPLFRERSTLGADYDFPVDAAEQLMERAAALLRIKAARDRLDRPVGERWIRTMLVLAAIEKGPSSAQAISALSRVSLKRVDEITGYLVIARWASQRGRRFSLTDLGRRELLRLRRRRSREPVLPTNSKPFYYPTQLRSR